MVIVMSVLKYCTYIIVQLLKLQYVLKFTNLEKEENH